MSGVLRFGVFELDLRSRELRKRGMRLHLPEQSFEILAMLVERPGDVVSREEIRARLWPHGTVVEFEHSVNSAVRRLRDCLGDSATTPRFVETLPRRGYRFLAPVEAGHASPPAPHFRILGELGRGGMGVVYKAEDLVLGRIVALKFLPEALASHPPSVERFGREARTLASLNHPGICALHGVEEHEGRVCLVMEYLEGRPLSRLIAGGPLPLKQALRIAADASEALAAAHAIGIVHHDVTPANIVVSGEGQVKLLDFGLAEIARREAARKGSSSGGPAVAGADGSHVDSAAAEGSSDHMSPEQIRGEAVDSRTDVYSLGVVLYEMLCGRPPFHADSLRPILAAILEDEPVSPRTLRHDMPHRVERLLLRCLEKKPEGRYSSAAELHRELVTCLSSSESGAWRRPAAVAAVAAAALLVGAVAFVGGRAAVQASRSRWVEREALPAAAQLVQEQRPFAALELIRKAERLTTPSAELIRFKDRLPALRESMRTTPPGAAIYALDYRDK
jgi:DNA-binding winged helix-turn-helix (wHTH) protein/predicted Ser/Thr protein kinase